MTCSECAEGCVGQTGRSFETRLSEHIQAFRSNIYNPNFCQFFVENEPCKGLVGNDVEASYTAEKEGGIIPT